MLKISKRFNDIFTELCVVSENSIRKKDHVPTYLLAIKTQMEQNYAEPLSLDDLENRYRVSRYRICREFSYHYGQSPIHYLNAYRIHIAKKLLLTTDLTIREVGSQIGIDNTNHFINLFKKDTGTTPLSFKQAAPVSVSDLHYN
uniref:helix-turn-helix transcriptional regulator n=1 Tax=Coprococcus sp. TaxID=2049024 RepID=UPI0040268AD1